MSESVRVLIADDHEVVREGLRMILETEDGFEVVGEASDGIQAVEMAGQLEPDVVLMDLRMPKMDGLEAIERIRTGWPRIAIVILTTYNEDNLMVRGLRAGARGFLLKDTSRQALFDSLRAAARGEALLLPEVVERLLAATPARGPSGRGSTGPALLTSRERAILERVARGERNKEIAAALGITERTVKAHLASIYNKLGVDSRAAAVAAAGALGFPPQGD
jgi:NarL family two-component system response regulator YdfI